jgi:CheY-like chemotaxis protein
VKPQRTILYAEDDPVVMTAYKSRLERAGYIVQPAVDGLEALKWLHQSPPDLILLDLMLPKFTGEEVLKYLNSNPALQPIPVIVLSTNSILTAANEGLIAKAQRHLLKHDCTFPNLLSTIEDLLAAGKETANAGNLARASKQLHQEAVQSADGNEPANEISDDPLVSAVRKLLNRPEVVCCPWTDQICIDGKWMKLTDFLTEQLHINVTHGISPEAIQQYFGEK